MDEIIERAINLVNQKGCINLRDAKEILNDLGLDTTTIPEKLVFSYQNEEEYRQKYHGEYYLYDNRPGKCIELHDLSTHICELLGIDTPSKRFVQKDIIAKINGKAIRKFMEEIL